MTTLPLLNLTLATLRSPELGFLGFVIPTRTQTPFISGLSFNCGDVGLRALCATRQPRMTWLYVAENGDDVLNARGEEAIGVRRLLLRTETLGRAVAGSLNRRVKRLKAMLGVWRRVCVRYRRLPVAVDVQLFKLQRVRCGNAQKGLAVLGTTFILFASRRITHMNTSLLTTGVLFVSFARQPE